MTQPKTETRKPTYSLEADYEYPDTFKIFASNERIGTMYGKEHALVLAELFKQGQCEHPRESVVILQERPRALPEPGGDLVMVCYKCGRILPEYPVDGDKETK
jgi:hypothetical protein